DVASDDHGRVVLVHAAPRVAHGSVDVTRDLAVARLALHLQPAPGEPGHAGADRVALAEQTARRVDRQRAVLLPDPLAHHPAGAALVAEAAGLDVLHLLVRERVVDLGVVDLLLRLRDPGHLVGLAGPEVGVVEAGEVLVRSAHVPVRVRPAADAAHPDRIVVEFARDPLAREDRGAGPVRHGTRVEDLHRPGDVRRGEDVLDRQFARPLRV